MAEILDHPTRASAELTAEIEQEAINLALNILEHRLSQRPQGSDSLTSPATVKHYLTLKLAELEHEVFYVLFLDVKNRLIADEAMFRGTLTHTSVYPREVVRAALERNAASVILAHNHPSGNTAPSEADRLLTQTLKQALTLVDVRVLDHIVIAGMDSYSFAEHGEA